VRRPINSFDLLELGHDAAEKIAAEIRMGASLVHCQLLASQFYDALRVKLEEASRPEDAATREMAAALRQCARAADANISPQRLLAELRSAVAVLEARDGSPMEPKPARPTLRVIQGGLA
jgi:hypothetical protein